MHVIIAKTDSLLLSQNKRRIIIVLRESGVGQFPKKKTAQQKTAEQKIAQAEPRREKMEQVLQVSTNKVL